MPEVSFTLDDKKITAAGGATILEVARQQGVEIPTLCNDPRLKPTAACRVCLVEVEGAKVPMPACTTPVTEGMVVKSNSEVIANLRKMALELLLSDHYGDCLAPCQLTCPAGIDIQGYVAHVANGDYRRALELIKETNPLPVVCGRVCPRFCEAKCRRNLVDEPIAINMLKRYVTDYDLESDSPYLPEPKPATGYKVAIVGGGPAGLTAAYYLGLAGHQVDIFDASPELGGMLRYGIPEYRLPKEILDKEISRITRLCHEVHCNTTLGKDITVESLKSEGYQAVFVALGAWADHRLRIEGEDLPGVLSGIGFLNNVTVGKEVAIGEKVVVVGGGNTAMDAARTALRLGAGEVVILYRRSREEMPAADDEIEQALEEGIKIHYLAAPVAVSAANGRVSSLTAVKMALGEPDSSGRRRPEPIEGSEFTMKVDNVIAAIGQRLDKTGLEGENGPELDKWGYLSINEETMATSQTGVFAGGDCTTGPATAVEAIGAGRRAAAAISRYLNGEAVNPPPKDYNCSKGELEEIALEDFETVTRLPRAEMPCLPAEERKKVFEEVELGLSEEVARKEAERCLSCGCQDVYECKLRELATEYRVDDSAYQGRRRHLKIHENEHPDILRDQNKCIACGCCVRICDEVMGIGAFGFTNRGFEARIEPALTMPLCETNCVSCSQCISSCPTGALTPRIHLPQPGPWQPETVSSVCPYCGVGCNLDLEVQEDCITTATSKLGSPVNDGNLCKKGAFRPGKLHEQERLKTPLIKRNGELTAVSWEEAISFASQGLGQIRDRAGGERLAVLASPELTNEENYLAQKLARMALRTPNITSLSLPVMSDELCRSFGSNGSTVAYSDVKDSDLIVIFDSDLAEEYPVIDIKVREAVGRGAKLISFSPRANRLDPLVDVNLKVNSRTSVGLLRAMLDYLISYKLVDEEFVNTRTAGFDELAREMKKYPLEKIADQLWIRPTKIVEATHLYLRARRPVIIVNADTITSAELNLLNNLAILTGNVGREGAGILAMRSGGNAQGLLDMGVAPGYLPGQQSIADSETRQKFATAWGGPLPDGEGRDAIATVHGIESGVIQGVVALGDAATGKIGNSLFEVPIFSVMLATTQPKQPPYPDVVLPAASPFESQGTYTNCERRTQQVRRVLAPPAGKENWRIISELAAALGYPVKDHSLADIEAEIARLVPFSGKDNAGKPPATGFAFKDGRARLRVSGSSEDQEVLYSLS